MGIFNVKAGQGAASEVPPAGSHPAVLVCIIDLGTHEEDFKQQDGTVKTADMHKVFLGWELTAEKCAGFNRNHIIGKDYNVSETLSPNSNLRKLIEGWRGKAMQNDEGIDLGKMLGAKCMVTITHKESGRGNTYAVMGAVAPPPKGLAVPAPGQTPFIWEIGSGPIPDHAWLPYVFLNRERVPIAKVIQASAEWMKLNCYAPPKQPQHTKSNASDHTGHTAAQVAEADEGDANEIPF